MEVKSRQLPLFLLQTRQASRCCGAHAIDSVARTGEGSQAVRSDTSFHWTRCKFVRDQGRYLFDRSRCEKLNKLLHHEGHKRGALNGWDNSCGRLREIQEPPKVTTRKHTHVHRISGPEDIDYRMWVRMKCHHNTPSGFIAEAHDTASIGSPCTNEINTAVPQVTPQWYAGTAPSVTPCKSIPPYAE